MQPKSLPLLWDIDDSASFILQISGSLSMYEYLENRVIRDHVERNFEIIGEAIRLIGLIDPDTIGLIDGHREIIGLRNRIAHGYRGIDDELMWNFVQSSLPILLTQVRELLQSSEPE
jgi:uncharacterized protein with HEPN domain